MAKITKDERGLLADGKPIDESTLLELGDEELERATPRTSTTAIACNAARAASTARELFAVRLRQGVYADQD